MPGDGGTLQQSLKPNSVLAGPPTNPAFEQALDELVATAKHGHRSDSEFFNPSERWLLSHMRVFQDLPGEEQEKIRQEIQQINQEAKEANAQGKAAARSGPGVVFRLNSGGVGFFSQLGVARRPDLTQYFIDGFPRNRDALAFGEANQALFAEVLPYATRFLQEHFDSGDTVVQTDRQIGDAPGRSFHARQILSGTRYLQLPYMWRQLTFDLPEAEREREPDILEVSFPHWLEELGMPSALKARIKESGLTQLVFKAPTKGLSLHMGFDYVGEHKMGPLSIAMFKAKQAKDIAVQSALSMARLKTLDGEMINTSLVTVGPSLHGKSTLTIRIEVANSDLAKLLDLSVDPEEGVYPMNDDIVLLQRLPEPIEVSQGGHQIIITHAIDGTENNFYAAPVGLTKEDDPITYDVIRGTNETPNAQETLENIPVDFDKGAPDFLSNPVRNMRATLFRSQLTARKGVQHLLKAITDGQLSNSVHVPMEHTNRIFWQAVMRQNTVIPPLRRCNLESYIRVLMYGEAVQMGAAAGAIGRPYVEYFSDPFIIGLEDENANLLYDILKEMAAGGLPQEYYVFNTGGVGAETNDEASGPQYKKIPRELTLMLQEALLRGAVKFEYEAVLGSKVAVAVVNQRGEEVQDLRKEWLPLEIYGEAEYARRVQELQRRRYYGKDAQDRAGILRYTKVTDGLFTLDDIPAPNNEREQAWLLSLSWHVDQAYNSLPELAAHLDEGQRPPLERLQALQQMFEVALAQGLQLSEEGRGALSTLGLRSR